MQSSITSLTPQLWKNIASGIWSVQQGPPELVTPLSVVNAAPRLEAISALPIASFPDQLTNVDIQQVSGKSVVRFPVGEQESIHGLEIGRASCRERVCNGV